TWMPCCSCWVSPERKSRPPTRVTATRLRDRERVDPGATGRSVPSFDRVDYCGRGGRDTGSRIGPGHAVGTATRARNPAAVEPGVGGGSDRIAGRVYGSACRTVRPMVFGVAPLDIRQDP